jgi:hypothetical protein
MGLATFGEHHRASEWMEEFRHRRYRDYDLPALDRIAAGGGWPEGTVYDAIANLWRVEAVEAWRTATGEDLFDSTAWYRERLGFLLMDRRPGLVEDPFGYRFHDYDSTGDGERNRGTIMNFTRIMGLILIQRYPDDPRARELQAYFAASRSDAFSSHSPDREFLWFDPATPQAPPSRLTHYAAGTGTLLARASWPRGARDDSPDVTRLAFQCGDHFSYHQHYDQNSFTLFRGGDLLVDSGVYSGQGTSDHDVNYYARTIAHNTLVVWNPSEDFTAARPDASSNDGGQRTFFPASRSPASVEDWDEAALQHDVCDMRRFEDAPAFTYALGDATKAYNNPEYNQAMDTTLAGNEAKVSRFQRELVYLRPSGPAAREYVVLYDRVAVTKAAFSGANTKLLFHFLSEPEVAAAGQSLSPGETLYPSASSAVATAGEGKLFAWFLLPAAHNVRKVGGRGNKAFWVDGHNYDWHWSPDEPQPRPTTEFDPEPYGEWRLELEPADTELEHAFLTVLHPAGSRTRQMPAAEVVDGKGVTGAFIADAALNRVVLFSAAADGAAPRSAVSYRFRPTAGSLHVIAGLTPGVRYTRTLWPARDGVSVRLVPEPGGSSIVTPEGTLSFTLGPDPLRDDGNGGPVEPPPAAASSVR